MADSYPRISRDGIRLWLEDPTTKAYLQCQEWYRQQLAEARGSSAFVGETHDATISNLYRNLGADEAAAFLSKPERVLGLYELIEEDAA